jgi:TRAP-type C4-dicarboxylate transport system substrate-binding protein
MRIRTQLSDLQGEALAALGFTPVATDVRTFAEELSGDLFDAQENPLTNSQNFGVFDHHRHVTLSGHFFGATVMICAEAAYRSWPADMRAAVDTAAREATTFQHRLALAADDEVLAQVDPAKNAVVHLDARERGRFEAAMQPVLEKYRRHIDPSLFQYMQ